MRKTTIYFKMPVEIEPAKKTYSVYVYNGDTSCCDSVCLVKDSEGDIMYEIPVINIGYVKHEEV